MSKWQACNGQTVIDKETHYLIYSRTNVMDRQTVIDKMTHYLIYSRANVMDRQ